MWICVPTYVFGGKDPLASIGLSPKGHYDARRRLHPPPPGCGRKLIVPSPLFRLSFHSSIHLSFRGISQGSHVALRLSLSLFLSSSSSSSSSSLLTLVCQRQEIPRKIIQTISWHDQVDPCGRKVKGCGTFHFSLSAFDPSLTCSLPFNFIPRPPLHPHLFLFSLHTDKSGKWQGSNVTTTFQVAISRWPVYLLVHLSLSLSRKVLSFQNNFKKQQGARPTVDTGGY